MMGRAPPTAIFVLASATQGGWNVDRLRGDRIYDIVKELMEREVALLEDLLQRVTAEPQTSRGAVGKGVLPVFHVGD